jgi:hypothetical protein
MKFPLDLVSFDFRPFEIHPIDYHDKASTANCSYRKRNYNHGLEVIWYLGTCFKLLYLIFFRVP